MKEVEADLQLLIEENRMLKEAKDKFEDQVKDNEEDEEKFQIQSQIFREELKRMSSSLKNVDECAVILFYGNKLAWEKVDMLDDDIQLKREYFKKYPKQRSLSKNSKRKWFLFLIFMKDIYHALIISVWVCSSTSLLTSGMFSKAEILSSSPVEFTPTTVVNFLNIILNRNINKSVHPTPIRIDTMISITIETW